ncbi:hypothetical protein OAG68_02150 [bacterium]|nr:hypothetical protein [bacterium]
MSFQRENEHSEIEFSDGEFWMNERDVCQHCRDEREASSKPFRWAEQRHSFGCYAGRYCDSCWPQSGYRDAIDSTAEFSEADAGERIESDY